VALVDGIFQLLFSLDESVVFVGQVGWELDPVSGLLLFNVLKLLYYSNITLRLFLAPTKCYLSSANN
jgi:hypothetical protein